MVEIVKSYFEFDNENPQIVGTHTRECLCPPEEDDVWVSIEGIYFILEKDLNGDEVCLGWDGYIYSFKPEDWSPEGWGI